MKTLLIVAAIIVFLVHGFVMYCCIKVRVLCKDRNIGTWKAPDVEWIRTVKQ